MSTSTTCSCGKPLKENESECYRCRVAGIGFTFKGGVRHGRNSWNQTATEWKQENFGTSDDRELAKRGIERADS